MKILDALTEYTLPLRKCSIKSPTSKCNYLFITNNGDLPSMNEVNDMGLKYKKKYYLLGSLLTVFLLCSALNSLSLISRIFSILKLSDEF